MKQVLIIDDNPFFRDYVQDKLEAEKIAVDISLNTRDGYSKMLSLFPDLAIYRSAGTFEEMIQFLEKKKLNPNATKIPIIIYGPNISKEQIARLVLFNVIKYFTQPVKIDLFFEVIGKILHTSFTIDSTPSILDAHVSDSIIFIEIAKGLNREKLGLLKYKIPELIKINNLINPKIVVIMTDLPLTFIDGINLELLLDSIIAEPKIRNKNVKILSLDPFTTSYVQGHPEYAEIEVVTNLATVLGSLIKNDEEDVDDAHAVISERLLQASGAEGSSSVQMKLQTDLVEEGEKGMPEGDDTSLIRVAMIEDDPVERLNLLKAFALIDAKTEQFETAPAFFSTLGKKEFDLVVLNLSMKNDAGWQVLTSLKQKNYPVPILVHAAVTNRDVLVKALSLGARGFLVKPLRPEVVVQKAIEILNSRI